MAREGVNLMSYWVVKAVYWEHVASRTFTFTCNMFINSFRCLKKSAVPVERRHEADPGPSLRSSGKQRPRTRATHPRKWHCLENNLINLLVSRTKTHTCTKKSLRWGLS